MATDRWPSYDEFGPGACTCNGTMTGCAVCSTANVLQKYGKGSRIPRLPSGGANMRALGERMGARHRAQDGRVGHGLNLKGRCSPPYSGTNWCTYCAYLEIRAAGIPAAHRQLTWDQIKAQLVAEHAVIMPGLYSRIPLVAEDSYSMTRPARGRSDSGFGGPHMMTAWAVGERYGTGTIRSFAVSDPDFGSPSRPVVPPHSLISKTALRNYWSALGWSVCYVTVKPPAASSAGTGWRATVKRANFNKYHIRNGVVDHRHRRPTTGFSADCSAPRTFRWPAENRTVTLVKIKSGSHAGQWISHNYAKEV